MSELTLELVFEGSVRMGTGHAGKGLDEVIDALVPLSNGGIKGVLRDEARILFPPKNSKQEFESDHPFVQAVFGDKFGRHCPWNFDIVPAQGKVSPRASLQLDADGSVVNGALLVKEEAWIPSATLHIYQRHALGTNGVPAGWPPDQVKEAHLALIHLAARLVDKIGQRKTRGMGWVAFTSADDPRRDVSQDLALINQVRINQAPGGVRP